ncbi:hypothetical protein F2Q69_00012147 [Brassica cretica]|uniref:Uncharacterized protein n=1 Tax=Brassica cretica TaxID=69181 RepID=A0A8S9QZZ9_BRACR|nr:hypothetical protein F2Q69_00012147 [Brassica cretica]
MRRNQSNPNEKLYNRWKKIRVKSLNRLKESQKKQRQGDNMFVIYPQIDGKGTATGGQFKADDSPAGYLLLPCYVQLGKLEKL